MDLLGLGRLAALLLLLVAAAVGCALFRKEGPGTEAAGRPGEAAAAEPGGPRTERTTLAPPGDRRTPERTDAGEGSPRRQASDRLVEEGKGYWIVGRNDEAWERLQQAVRLDGSNGVALYYLAEIAAEEGDRDDAAGYRERAAALLSGRSEYAAALDDLARRIAERR